MTVTLGVHWTCHLVLIALRLQVPRHLYIEHEQFKTEDVKHTGR